MTLEFPATHQDLTVLLREERRREEGSEEGRGSPEWEEEEGKWDFIQLVGERMMLAPHRIQRGGDF